MAEEEGELDAAIPSRRLLLVSAFMAMEPSDALINLARECGGGSIAEQVQRFIWDHCISNSDGKCYEPYMKKFLKKLISEIEANHEDVLDELYDQYAHYMISVKDDSKENSRILKYISFLFPADCLEIVSCPRSMKLMIPLQCSLNMLEGDTGCSIWPSSLFLSEFILSNPEIFSSKLCFEVGSGVGLVGICLAHVKASKVILSDGDLSTLANMKLNLELNQLMTHDELGGTYQDSSLVKCVFLPWETAKESQLQGYMPDIILAADVIYDPLCLPYLVRVLKILLNPHGFDDNRSRASRVRRVAYIASVIRNADTFNCFLTLADQARLTVMNVTEQIKLFDLLPYMQSYDRSSLRLYTVSYFCN